MIVTPQNRGNTVSEVVKNFRMRMHLTQTQLAGELGTTSNTVARWESGKVAPGMERMVELALDALMRFAAGWKPPMLRPLSQWVCDTCGELIETENAGWLEWLGGERGNREFRIVHQYVSSPRQRSGTCYQHENAIDRLDNHLEYFAMGRNRNYAILPPNSPPEGNGIVVASLDEYLEVTFRLTVPFYEEARFYREQALRDEVLRSEAEMYEISTGEYLEMISNFGPLELPIVRAATRRGSRR
jgi:transcriptional regulator with XRE-family HTH domain